MTDTFPKTRAMRVVEETETPWEDFSRGEAVILLAEVIEEIIHDVIAGV